MKTSKCQRIIKKIDSNTSMSKIKFGTSITQLQGRDKNEKRFLFFQFQRIKKKWFYLQESFKLSLVVIRGW